MYLADATKNKGIMYFSASSRKDAEFLFNFGINDILVSYHYIKKNLSFYPDFLKAIKDSGGHFMVDSGAFSLLADRNFDGVNYDWEKYIDEYVGWCNRYKEYITVAANMDMEGLVGADLVDYWNDKFFKPLEKHMDVVYVAHGCDRHDIFKRFKEYCINYGYVGVSSSSDEYDKAGKFYTIAKNYNVRIHGFGWTSIPKLKSFPFYSVDSTTWLGGVRYGTSYNYDGKNFRVNAYYKKYVRKGDKVLCRKYGINYTNLMSEERESVNGYNLIGWLGARKEYLRMANLKLKNKVVSFYDKA